MMSRLFPFRFVRLSSIKRLKARISYLEKKKADTCREKDRAEAELYRIYEARSDMNTGGTRIDTEALLKTIDKSFVRRLKHRG